MRIGKAGGNSPRPLKIILENKKDRDDVLYNARNLKGNVTYRGVAIAKDLTPTEREAEKQMREELARRRQQGERVKIYNGRIVQVEKRDNPP